METLDFWKSNFGDDYIKRNISKQLLASNLVFFGNILGNNNIRPESIFEVGANVGMNIMALQQLLPDCSFSALEVNDAAYKQLKNTGCEAHLGPIETFQSTRQFELVLSKGVLIHINPSELSKVYKKLIDLSSRWILIAEYFSRTPTDIPYQGQTGVLFKRDFASEFLAFQDLSLVTSGFASRLSHYPQDDLNWYLFEKRR